MVSYISWLAEELVPFVYYAVRSRRLLRKCVCKNILKHSEFAGFTTLSVCQLKDRVEEEHRRASAMDEKTFKLTLSLSVALTVLGSMGALVTRVLSSAAVEVVLTILFGVGLFYVLAAGLTAVGALRTRKSYGYGTQFLLKQQEEDAQTALADALARQETMNLVGHLRNESAYQALRNGLVLLFVGILLFSMTLTVHSMRSGSSVADSVLQWRDRGSKGQGRASGDPTKTEVGGSRTWRARSGPPKG